MSVFGQVERKIADALRMLHGEGLLPAEMPDSAIATEVARDASHGDIASNVAMVLAKPARKNPRDLASQIACKLSGDPMIAKAEVAGPGFLNLTLQPGVWHGVVRDVLAKGAEYGRPDVGAGVRVNVEYVSANPTGPMHVGHCRGAVFGDALASLLSFAGHDVTREYYVNDAGAQVDVLARSAYLRYREALGETIGEIPAGLYPGDYLKPVGAALAAKFGRELLDVPETAWLAAVRAETVGRMLEMIKQDLAALDIRHDVFFFEHSLVEGTDNEVAAAIAELRGKGLVYEGRLPKPKGHDGDDWEDRDQTLFRSTAFGDDEDRALMKSDGTYTYFANDIAYHYNKLRRGYGQLINVLGADHVGYIRRLKAVVAALSDRKIALETPVCNLVKLLRAGEPVRMSKRAGTFVTLRDVLDEVGSDPIRYMMLYRKNDSELEFDLVKVLEQSKDNPVFYVQYAHARAASVLRNATEALPRTSLDAASLNAADLARLVDAGEIELMKRLAYFPKLIAGAARDREPHRIAFYLYDLASAFHQQWTRGNDLPHLRYIRPDDEGVTAARLALIAATQRVIASGLGLLGVRAPDEMR